MDLRSTGYQCRGRDPLLLQERGKNELPLEEEGTNPKLIIVPSSSIFFFIVIFIKKYICYMIQNRQVSPH